MERWEGQGYRALSGELLGAGHGLRHLASPGLEPLKASLESRPHPEASAAGGRAGRWLCIWGGWEMSLCFQRPVFLPFSPSPSPSPSSLPLSFPSLEPGSWSVARLSLLSSGSQVRSTTPAEITQCSSCGSDKAFLFSCVCGPRAC